MQKNILEGGYLTALGIRADEPQRLNKNKKNVFYPLAEINVTEKFIREFWSKQPFDLKLKDYQGNCDLCFLKSKRKRMTIISEDKTISEWWTKMEQNHADESRPMFDVRGNVTIEQLVEMAQKPFCKAVDKHEERQQNKELFDFDLDIDFNCFCGN